MNSKITSLSDWAGQRKTRPLTLPSGKTIEVVENQVLPLITNSFLPLTLLSKVVDKGQDENALKDMEPEDKKKIVDGYNKLMNLITEIVVAPKITLDDLPKIPGTDLQFLLAYLMRGKEVAALASFRDEFGGSPARADVQEVQAETVAGGGPA